MLLSTNQVQLEDKRKQAKTKQYFDCNGDIDPDMNKGENIVFIHHPGTEYQYVGLEPRLHYLLFYSDAYDTTLMWVSSSFVY